MYPYTYHVSLRIFHPEADPQVFTDTLGMKPDRAWKVGERRTTRKGALLEGLWEESFWHSPIIPPNDSDFARFLLQTAERLAPHLAFFNRIREAGGRVEFYVSLYPGGGTWGETLQHGLLVALGRLGIDVSLDLMYVPEDKPSV
jgi:hypothetical protein